MAADRMDIKPFTTEEIGGARVTPRSRGNQARSNQRRRSGSMNARKKQPRKLPSAMAVKVGICVVACGFMFTMKALEVPGATQMVSGVRTAVNDQTEIDETLGKLQFVEFPAALEVFAGSSKMAMPVSAPYVTIDDDAQYAEWDGAPYAQVMATAAGEVRAIGEDEILGRYVRIAHADDLETIYYGLETVQVEQGQPIRKLDTIGALGDDGVLRLCVLQAGSPQSPEGYLDLVR